MYDLSNIIHAHVQKFETFDLLEAPEAPYVVFGEVEGAQGRHQIEALNGGQLIGAEVQFLDPEIGQVLNLVDLVAVEGKDAQAFVCA